MKQLFFLIFLCMGVADAASIKNKDLLQACRDNGPAGQNFCYGFIVSAANAAQYYRNFVDVKGNYLDVCFPPAVTNREIVKTYVKWLEKHPAVLDGAAFIGVSTALSSQYSCPERPRP